jgi:hypothetical protein
MISLIRTVAALAASAGVGAGLPPGAGGQTAPAAPFEAAADSVVRRAADSLDLSIPQRTVFYANVDTAVASGILVNPSGGRSTVDSAVRLVVRETGRKLRFVRQARILFSEMFARRAGDPNRAPGTEEDLWRSPANVSRLIELYRDNPDASDHELERAMAGAFRR